MSGRYDYQDLGALMAIANNFEPLQTYGEFEYAIKYVSGLLDREKCRIASLKAKKEKTQAAERRIHMLKSLLKTLVDVRTFPLPTPKSKKLEKGQAYKGMCNLSKTPVYVTASDDVISIVTKKGTAEVIYTEGSGNGQ